MVDLRARSCLSRHRTSFALASASTSGVLVPVSVTVEPVDLSSRLNEDLVSVEARSSRCLKVWHVVRLGIRHCLVVAHLSLVGQVDLVADQYHRHRVFILDAQDLLNEGVELCERGSINDAEHNQEALACAHVSVSHGRVLLLSCRVEDVQEDHVARCDGDLLAVAVFDGWVVFWRRYIETSGYEQQQQ